MNEQNIIQLVDLVNHPLLEQPIFKVPLAPNVCFAWIQPLRDQSALTPWEPYSVYFIFNEDGVCVAAVFDMKTDLHWYVVPGYRKKGHLSSAMRSAILPHLSTLRDEQRITINAYYIGEENHRNSYGLAQARVLEYL